MSILPARTIRAEIAAGRLIKNADPDQVQPCSYDLRIGTIFQNGKSITQPHAGAADQIELKPGGVVSMFTLEELSLPADVCATVFPLNSQSSKGLLVLNPGHVDAGFNGAITVKLLNISRHEKILKLGEPIFTAIFDRLEAPTNEPYPPATTTRVQRERAFAQNDLNESPDTLSKLVGELTDDHVNKLIRAHWYSRATLLVATVAAVFALIAAFPVFKDARGATQEHGLSLTRGDGAGSAPQAAATQAPASGTKR